MSAATDGKARAAFDSAKMPDSTQVYGIGVAVLWRAGDDRRGRMWRLSHTRRKRISSDFQVLHDR
ncbi:MAG TPA: hypothetical protein VHU19_11650 [Pyrinomonadaceae bacterium]|nr:hypothetical protein [Pyrinomonadaceae bacterium]